VRRPCIVLTLGSRRKGWKKKKKTLVPIWVSGPRLSGPRQTKKKKKKKTLVLTLGSPPEKGGKKKKTLVLTQSDFLRITLLEKILPTQSIIFF
jgi:hypothetical protein